MPRDYAAFTTLVTTKLQSAGTVDFTVAEVDYQIEECLKEFADFSPHIIPVIFKIESRYGEATATSASSLVDTRAAGKGQFLAADATDEKVVHNTTDNTWAVVLSQANTSSIGLSRDIFTINEAYRIYNKRCWNKKQIFIGDVVSFPEIESVEYPIGQKRNWKLLGDVLEIDVDVVDDSDSTQAALPDVDILVRFKRPHVLSQLTDWVGVLAASAAVAATAISLSSLQSAGTIEEGEEFYLENQKTLYVVSASATIASSTAVISIYPGLEAAASSTWAITFRKSSLEPKQEEIFADLVAARLAINKAPKYFNAIPLGGGVVWQNFLSWGERRLAEVLGKLRRENPPQTKRRWPTA